MNKKNSLKYHSSYIIPILLIEFGSGQIIYRISMMHCLQSQSIFSVEASVPQVYEYVECGVRFFARLSDGYKLTLSDGKRAELKTSTFHLYRLNIQEKRTARVSCDASFFLLILNTVKVFNVSEQMSVEKTAHIFFPVFIFSFLLFYSFSFLFTLEGNSNGNSNN